MIFHQFIASPVEHDDILNASIYRLIKSLRFKILGCVPQLMKKIEHSFVLRLFVQPLCIYKHSPAGSVKCSLCCFVSGRHLKGQIQIQPMLPAIRVEILFISSHSLVTGSQFL